MTLRTTALIAGGLGLLLLIAGLVADAMRPQSFGTPSTRVDTAAVVVGPDNVAIAPGGSLTFTGSGDLVVYAGRAADAAAWVATREVTVITGVPAWEELSTRVDAPASPEASASASPPASPSAAPSASPSPSASASGAPAPEPEIADVWRTAWTGSGSVDVATAEVPPGLTLVAESVDGSPLTGVEMVIYRSVDDSWVSPLKWWGAVLAAFGLIALVSLLVDVRATRSRVEATVAGRRPSRAARPGSRRERRETATATGGIPVVADTAEPWTGEVPRVDTGDAAAHSGDGTGDATGGDTGGDTGREPDQESPDPGVHGDHGDDHHHGDDHEGDTDREGRA